MICRKIIPLQAFWTMYFACVKWLPWLLQLLIHDDMILALTPPPPLPIIKNNFLDNLPLPPLWLHNLWMAPYLFSNNHHFSFYKSFSSHERDIFMAHMMAVQRRQLSYLDKKTGFDVLTVTQLIYNEECCGNGCRHCPYEHENCTEEVKNATTWNGSFYLDKRIVAKMLGEELKDPDSLLG